MWLVVSSWWLVVGADAQWMRVYSTIIRHQVFGCFWQCLVNDWLTTIDNGWFMMLFSRQRFIVVGSWWPPTSNLYYRQLEGWKPPTLWICASWEVSSSVTATVEHHRWITGVGWLWWSPATVLQVALRHHVWNIWIKRLSGYCADSLSVHSSLKVMPTAHDWWLLLVVIFAAMKQCQPLPFTADPDEATYTAWFISKLLSGSKHHSLSL